LAQRRILHETAEAASVLHRVDHGRDHRRGARVQEPRGGGELADGDPEDGGLSRCRDEGNGSYRGGEVDRTMLHVDRDRVEPFPCKQSGNCRIGETSPGGEGGCARPQAVSQDIDGEHGNPCAGQRHDDLTTRWTCGP
jgi:hypothetical protein